MSEGRIVKTVLPAVLLIVVLAVVQACAVQTRVERIGEVNSLPLPESTLLPCCWQSQEVIRLTFEGSQHDLNSALLVGRSGLTLLIFDALGRKLIQLTQKGTVIESQHFVDAALPMEWILRAVYLSHMDPSRWDLGETKWSISATTTKLILMHSGNTVAEVVGGSWGARPKLGSKRHINFASQALRLDIMTASVTAITNGSSLEDEQ